MCEKQLQGSTGVKFSDGVWGGTQIADTPGYGSKFDMIGSLVFCLCDDCIEQKSNKGFIAMQKIVNTRPTTKWKIFNPYNEEEGEWFDDKHVEPNDIESDVIYEWFDNTICKKFKGQGWGRGERLDEDGKVVYFWGFNKSYGNGVRFEAPTNRELFQKMKNWWEENK